MASCLLVPPPLVKDEELVELVRRLICCRGARATRVSLVKGHADEEGHSPTWTSL